MFGRNQVPTKELQLRKMNRFVEGISREDAAAAADFYNESDYMQYIVNSMMIWFHSALVESRSDLEGMSQQELVTHTKTLLTAFLVNEFGRAPFEREL